MSEDIESLRKNCMALTHALSTAWAALNQARSCIVSDPPERLVESAIETIDDAIHEVRVALEPREDKPAPD